MLKKFVKDEVIYRIVGLAVLFVCWLTYNAVLIMKEPIARYSLIVMWFAILIIGVALFVLGNLKGVNKNG